MDVSSPNSIMRNAPSLEPFGILALFCASELVLPTLSILLFAEAAIAAIMARLIHVQENTANVTLWDFAGAFTLIGCAATIFGEPDQAALFFEQQTAQRPDSRP